MEILSGLRWSNKTKDATFQWDKSLFVYKMKLQYCDYLEVLPYDVDSE